jgi:hypothetical protein
MTNVALYTAIDEARDAINDTKHKASALYEENISMQQQLGRLEAAVAKMELQIEHKKKSGHAGGNAFNWSAFTEKNRLRGPQNWRQWLNLLTDELSYMGYNLPDKKRSDDNKPFTARDEEKIRLLVLDSVMSGPRELVAKMEKGTKMIAKLNGRYGGQTEEPFVVVWEKLQDKCYDGGCPIKHVREFNGLVDKNKDVGNVFTKSQLVSMFLRGVSNGASIEAEAWAGRSREAIRFSSPSRFTTLRHLHKSFISELRECGDMEWNKKGNGKSHDNRRKTKNKGKRRGKKKTSHGTTGEDGAVADGWESPNYWDWGNTWDDPATKDNSDWAPSNRVTQGESNGWGHGWDDESTWNYPDNQAQTETQGEANNSGHADSWYSKRSSDAWSNPDTSDNPETQDNGGWAQDKTETQSNGGWVQGNTETRDKSDYWGDTPSDADYSGNPDTKVDTDTDGKSYSAGNEVSTWHYSYTQGNADLRPYDMDNPDDGYGSDAGRSDGDSWLNGNKNNRSDDEDQKNDSWDVVDDNQYDLAASQTREDSGW